MWDLDRKCPLLLLHDFDGCVMSRNIHFKVFGWDISVYVLRTYSIKQCELPECICSLGKYNAICYRILLIY